MIIDTEFNVGDNVCYLSGDKIYYTTIKEINMALIYNRTPQIKSIVDYN